MPEINEKVLKRCSFIIECTNEKEKEVEIEIIILQDYINNIIVVQVNQINIEKTYSLLLRKEEFKIDEITKADIYYCFEISKYMHKWRQQ